LKVVPLKINLFAWRLYLNRIPTKDNLLQRRVLSLNDQISSGGCGLNEDRDHLLGTCDFYGNIWKEVSFWLGFSTVAQQYLLDHFIQFASLGGFSKHACLAFNIIWLSVMWVIWK
jgi:hypothetical protein